jgi:putative ABC transport system permease protein
MFKNYFTVALRGFLRNKTSSIINIGGLMLGLTTGIVICLWMDFEFGYDKFHADHKNIQLVEMNQVYAGILGTGNGTPGPLGPAVRSGVPGLKYVARSIVESEALTRYEETAIFQHGLYAEPDFFHIMSFPAIEGDPVATLREGSRVVLTQSAAQRLFGPEPALGKTIVLDNIHPLIVGAVIRDIPPNSSIQFDLALPFSMLEPGIAWLRNWEDRGVQTWLQLRPGARLEAINRQMTQLLVKNVDWKKNADWKKASLFAYPMARLHLFDNFKDGQSYWGKAYLYMAIAVMALLTLLIACINFMNLSTAMAERRAREVGVRKVLGASRRRLMGQFLGEAVLLAMAALVVSIGLAYIAVPWVAPFNEIPLRSEFGHPWIWVLLALLGIVTGLIAGSYPALYLSRFQPAKVLKRLMSTGRNGGLLRKGLVSFQFVVSIFLVVITVVLVRQINYMIDRPLGFATSNLIDIAADGDLPAHYELFRTKARNIPGVENLTASTSNLLTAGATQTGLDWPGKNANHDIVFSAMWVRYDWTQTVGLKLAEGRDFSREFGTDSSACLINQEAVRRMALKGPVLGATINGKTVIGVLDDFVFAYAQEATQPLIVYLGRENLGHILVRLTTDGQWKSHLAQIEKTVKAITPGFPVRFRFTEDEHPEQFKGSLNAVSLGNIFSVLAILISCMGLFGLASFLVERRTREMSIRKVLGATPASLWISLALDMLKPVSLGVVVGLPLAIMTSVSMVNVAEYHIRLSWGIFAIPAFGALVIALATVSYHGVRASRVNPARVLATE